MHRHRGWIGLVVLLLSLGPVSQARAVITYVLPLGSILGDSEHICLVKVEAFDPDRPSMVLSVEEDLKGKLPARKLPVLLKGDAEAARLKHVPELLKRLDRGLSLVLFVSEQEGKQFGFCYSNGTWFQIIGTKDGDSTRWALTHGEPGLRRTFKGPTADLRQAVADVLAKKKQPPKPDEKEKPGFGPEVEKKDDKKQGRAAGGPLFAVIPTVAIGGPLAILALLFPAVFGGVLVLFRRWIVFISVVGINSTLYTAHAWYAEELAGRWWATPRVLWLTMTVLTLLGVGLTWRRQVRVLALPDASPERPTTLEQWLLYVFTAGSLVGLVLLAAFANGAVVLDFPLPLAISVGLWAGALATAWHVLSLRRGNGGSPRLPTEGIVLGTMAVASVLLIPEGARSTTATVEASAPQVGQRAALKLGVTWEFDRMASGKTQYDVSASPVVDGNRVYIGLIHASAFGGRRGVVYCLDRTSKDPVWTFDADGSMVNMFSSPVLADGKLYIGEGFHEDHDCRLFCLDAATGKPAWKEPFASKSHIESTPAVADGKVVFGAGDDGVYCVDAATGAKLWQYPSEDGGKPASLGLHVDASPIVVGRRVYCCSGVSQKYQRLQVFCLDLDTGKQVWATPEGRIDLPCWGSPTVQGDRVYVGLGNGRLTISDANPRGGVLCLDARTGEIRWDFRHLKDAVHGQPAVDDHHVYFGSRDGNCYCVERHTGQLVWKKELGSAVVASPALAGCTHCGATSSLYVASDQGMIYCLDPNTGAVHWQHSEMTDKHFPQLLSSPFVVVGRTPEGDRRQVYFATGLEGLGTGTRSARLFCLEDRWFDGTTK